MHGIIGGGYGGRLYVFLVKVVLTGMNVTVSIEMVVLMGKKEFLS